MSVFSLTARQRRRLREELAHCRDARLYRRVLALLEVDAGRPIAQVAQSLGVARQSVHNWLRSYQECPKLESLRERPRSGRPVVWDEAIRKELRGLLEVSPREYGYLANTWTVSLLQEYLRQTHGLECGENTVRRELHRLGYAWKRSRYTLHPDPDLEKKTTNSPISAEVGASERSFGRG